MSFGELSPNASLLVRFGEIRDSLGAPNHMVSECFLPKRTIPGRFWWYFWDIPKITMETIGRSLLSWWISSFNVSSHHKLWFISWKRRWFDIISHDGSMQLVDFSYIVPIKIDYSCHSCRYIYLSSHGSVMGHEFWDSRSSLVSRLNQESTAF